MEERDVEFISPSNTKKVFLPSGLYIFSYALTEIYWERITPRDAFLLGHVDYKCNPYGDIDPEYKEPSVFKISTLIKILQTSRKQVRRIIEKLTDLELLKAWKIGETSSVWQLATKERKRGEGDLLIHPIIRQGFEEGDVNGKLTPMESLFMAKISCFTLCGKDCWVSNKYLGECFGLSEERARKVIHELIRKKWLHRIWDRHDIFRSVSRESRISSEDEKECIYPKRGNRYGRVLLPTNCKLWRKGAHLLLPASID